MNAREQTRFDMLKRVATFGTNNASDFTNPRPPATKVTAGQTHAKQLFDDLSTPETGLIDRIAKNAETQQTGSGTARGGTTSKTVLRDALLLELKGINRTAAAIAVSQEKPEIMDKFRIPHGDSDAVLVAKAKAIAEAASGFTADFDIYGHEATFVADFLAQIDAFNKAEGTQDTGQQTRAGATEGFAPLLQEAMTKVKQLDAFIQNFHRSSAEKLGEWKTASHVERQANKKETPAATPPPKPNP
jgi:hypothetical protein